MDYKQVERTLGVFKDLSTYIRVLEIINRKYSPVRKNFSEITILLNKLLGLEIDICAVINFIHQIKLFPLESGYLYTQRQETFINDYYEYCYTRNEATKSLSPKLEYCLICSKSEGELEFRAPPFTKDCFLFNINRIGS